MSRKGAAASDFDPALPAPLTRKQKAELDRLAALPDEAINTSEIPPLSEAFWRTAQRGRFYRPVKQQLTLRLDADLVAWFKTHAPDGRGYQTEMNRALREHVHRTEKKQRAGG